MPAIAHIPAANVTLDNVDVSETTQGTGIETTGNVTITNSHFDSTATAAGDDPKSGLRIFSGGNVTLNNVSASNNHGTGLEIYGYGEYDDPRVYYDPTGQVSIQNSSFNNNTVTLDELAADDDYWAWGWGLVEGSGTINGDHLATTLANVNSSGNSRGTTVFSSGDMTISNSTFDNTYQPSPASLTIWSGGVVTLQNISASNNYGDGVDIFGVWNGGDPANPLSGGSPAYVDIRDSVFSNNHGEIFGYDTTDGVFCVMGSGGATVSGNIFFNNTGYGFECVGSGTVVDTGNQYSGNRLGTGRVLGGGTLLSTPLAIGQLPSALPAGYSFVAGMDVLATAAGTQLSFDIPAGTTVGSFKVLQWNGSQWMDVPYTVVDGQVLFTPTSGGTFVLVTG